MSKPAPNAVRISGGQLRGQVVAVPKSARPTEGRVREALFSIWQDRIAEARVVDLFAGSGAVGIEAWSRGAAEVVCVENDPAAFRLLEANCRKVARGGVRAWRASVPGGLADLRGHYPHGFDLAFVDPPYVFSGYDKLLAATELLLAPEGEIALEHSSRAKPPLESGRLVRVDERRYGESSLSFYRRASAS